MTYYTIISDIDGKTTVESFFIESEIDLAMDDLDRQTTKYLGEDFFPMEDGTIGFYSSNGNCVYMEERNINEIKFS